MSLSSSSSKNMRVVPFGLSIPPALLGPHARNEENGMGLVGTITFLGSKSVMVWFGLGPLSSVGTGGSKSEAVGTASNRPMGPLVLAMPRSRYTGAFGGQTPTSKLVGDESEDVELLASQMAARLTQRTQRAVFLSCDLSNGMHDQKLAALAEREVFRVISTTGSFETTE